MDNRRSRAPRSLFEAVTNYSLQTDPRHSIRTLSKDNISMIRRLVPYRRPLSGHRGCVNTIHWSSDGTKLLSGADDQRLMVYDPFRYDPLLVDYKTSHKSNVFSAKFLPNWDDTKIVSCAGDGEVLYTDLNAAPEDNSRNLYKCHAATCYEVLTIPGEAFTFYTCGEDGTVRFYDLRSKSNCNCTLLRNSEDILIMHRKAVTSMSINPRCPYELATGLTDCVRTYDRRNLGTPANNHAVKQFVVPDLGSNGHRITSVVYSADGLELLASFSSDNVYLWSALDGDCSEAAPCTNPESKAVSSGSTRSKRLRLRGDWSDTGPSARPVNAGEIGQARPTLQASLMDRMTMFMAEMLRGEGSRQQGQGPAPREGQGSQGPSSSASEPLQLSIGEDQEWRPTAEERLGAVSMPGTSVNEILPESSTQIQSSDEGITLSLNSPSPSSDTVGNPVAGPSTPPMSMSPPTPTETPAPERSRRLLPTARLLQQYTGHRNSRTMIKECNYWGQDYVMSGSDCGHIFFWEKATGALVFVIEADSHVVNCIQPHPSYPLLAVSGIDYNIKLFAPMAENWDGYDEEAVSQLVTRNKVMLEETKDTITVPAAFMIRMLTTLNHIRRQSAPAAAAAAGGSQIAGDREGRSNERGDDDDEEPPDVEG